MPPTTPLDPDPTQKDLNPHDTSPANAPGSALAPGVVSPGEVVETPSDQPVTFIPHAADGSVPSSPVLIRSARFGELHEHELVRLLDSIEDERARSRFRESIYISLFFWVVILWVLLYGPKYLWHAPRLISPAQALHQQELTVLNAPVLSHPAPKLPQKALDAKTLEKLRAMNPKPAPVAPQPRTPPPPTTSTLPSNPTPAMPAPVNPPPVTERTPPPIVADAPTPQPSTHPNFSTPSTSDSMRGLAGDVARDRNSLGDSGGGGSRRGSGGPLKMGGVEVLSPNPNNVDLGPYLRKIIADVYRNWYPLIPEEANPPLSKQGETLIRFTINPDGTIGGMHLDGSTHDDAINRSCWGSITSEGQFPALPKNWSGPLELRFHYLVNKQPQ